MSLYVPTQKGLYFRTMINYILGGTEMRELSVYFCVKCGHYAYFQLPKNAVCHQCKKPMTQLSMNHHDFTSLDYEARDRVIAAKMIEASPTLCGRITAPEKLYQQRKLVGTLTQQIADMETEIKRLNDTIDWMHTTIWDQLRKKQALKEELNILKEFISENRQRL